jgi:alpha-beta hydrolase superfamily lysophospholipase
MKRHFFASIPTLVAILSSASAADTPTTKPTDFHGYARIDFTLDTCPCILVSPKTAAPGNPWIWRAKFFDTAPQLDLALLAKGYHLAYMEIGNTFGAPDALKHWDVFYKEMTDKYHLSPKPILEGLSRGGLYDFNWAAANPDEVALIVGDNAVCDFKSWPGNKRATTTKKDWQAMLQAYGFHSDEEALAYKKNPIDNLQPLADAHIPIFLLAADADTLLPFEENSKLLAVRYQKLGGTVTLYTKHGFDHHPHGLDDPTPIVTFIEQSAQTRNAEDTIPHHENGQ